MATSQFVSSNESPPPEAAEARASSMAAGPDMASILLAILKSLDRQHQQQELSQRLLQTSLLSIVAKVETSSRRPNMVHSSSLSSSMHADEAPPSKLAEVKSIQIRRGEIWCAMHYIDFPDEKTNFMKAYQQDPSGKKKRVLMVRPSFPLMFIGVEESIINDAAGPVVVVNDNWWVGDLVDWFTDGCFWAAKIIAVINKEFVQVELPSAPYGEGGRYEAAVKDIRPSLDWSIEKFWTVPSIKSNTLRASTMDVSSWSLISPVQFETLDKEHIFIAKQGPFKQALNNSDAEGINNLMTSSPHALNYAPNAIQEEVVKDSVVVTMDMQKNGLSECARVTSLDDQKIFPLGFHGRSFTCSNKRLNKGPLLPFSTNEQGLGSRSSQRQEESNQVRMEKTDGLEAPQKPPQQASALDMTDKTKVAQSSSSKEDALSTLNDMGEALLFKELNTFLGDEKLLDLSDERIGSSIVALEELISRLAWLRGVMQLGLKGWCKERRKRKWVLFEREDHPLTRSENSAELV
ncbi:hypothetical protein L7F22_055963 [Adiantum nelumboides]|nr:hypothetical protein [Adiantum nelumboides]